MTLHSQSLARAIAAIERATDPNSEINTARRIARITRHKAARRGIVNGFMRRDSLKPLLRWLSAISPRDFLSTADAATWLRKEYRRRRKLAAQQHWSAKSYPMSPLKDRLVVAIYYAKHGHFYWQREAA